MKHPFLNYCKLERAARILDCELDDFIHWAAYDDNFQLSIKCDYDLDVVCLYSIFEYEDSMEFKDEIGLYSLGVIVVLPDHKGMFSSTDDLDDDDSSLYYLDEINKRCHVFTLGRLYGFWPIDLGMMIALEENDESMVSDLIISKYLPENIKFIDNSIPESMKLISCNIESKMLYESVLLSSNKLKSKEFFYRNFQSFYYHRVNENGTISSKGDERVYTKDDFWITCENLKYLIDNRGKTVNRTSWWINEMINLYEDSDFFDKSDSKNKLIEMGPQGRPHHELRNEIILIAKNTRNKYPAVGIGSLSKEIHLYLRKQGKRPPTVDTIKRWLKDEGFPRAVYTRTIPFKLVLTSND